MAIDTANEQFALISFGRTTEPMNLPVSPTWGSDDQQHVLWGYPGILWGAAAALAFVFDMNTRLQVYLCSLYSADAASDLTPKVRRHLDGQTTGDATDRMRTLIQDATDAMT